MWTTRMKFMEALKASCKIINKENELVTGERVRSTSIKWGRPKQLSWIGERPALLLQWSEASVSILAWEAEEHLIESTCASWISHARPLDILGLCFLQIFYLDWSLIATEVFLFNLLALKHLSSFTIIYGDGPSRQDQTLATGEGSSLCAFCAFACLSLGSRSTQNQCPKQPTALPAESRYPGGRKWPNCP